jgi:hypothetical protein
MHIAFDLDGTLIPDCGEFRCTSTRGAARLFLTEPLRTGTRELCTDLRRAGHRVSVYTLSDRPVWRIYAWLFLRGIPVRKVVTKKAHDRAVQSGKITSKACKWPPVFGFDLLLDDDPGNVRAARAAGCEAIQITNHDDDWTLKIRVHCLTPDATLTLKTT